MLHNSLFMEQCHFVSGLAPVADFYASATSDVVDVRDYEKIVFVLHTGVGTTGVPLILVQACDDVVPTNTTAVAFRYRVYTGATGSSETPGAITAATSAGFNPAAGSDRRFIIEVDAETIQAAGYNYVRLSFDDSTGAGTVDASVLGGVLILCLNPKYAGAAAPRTALT